VGADTEGLTLIRAKNYATLIWKDHKP